MQSIFAPVLACILSFRLHGKKYIFSCPGLKKHNLFNWALKNIFE